MKSVYNNSFLADVHPVLADHYCTVLPFCKNAITAVVTRYSKVFASASGMENHQALATLFDESYKRPLMDYLTRSGKMFRPYLVCLCLEAYGKDYTQWPSIVALAEIIHSSSLVLDDIADNSFYRRGKPTAHQLYGVRVAGSAASAWLNAGGDLVWDCRENLGDANCHALLKELAYEHFVTGVGTAVDVTWAWRKSGDHGTDTYMQQVMHRSTSYTYRLPLKIGAISADAPAKDREILSKFGESVGLAFQLIDDMLNAVSDDPSWGKEIAEDIDEGKYTLQVIIALEELDSTDRATLLEVLGSKCRDEKRLKNAVQLLKKTNAFANCTLLASKYIEEAKALVSSLAISQENIDKFIAFADYIVTRNR